MGQLYLLVAIRTRVRQTDRGFLLRPLPLDVAVPVAGSTEKLESQNRVAVRGNVVDGVIATQHPGELALREPLGSFGPFLATDGGSLYIFPSHIFSIKINIIKVICNG